LLPWRICLHEQHGSAHRMPWSHWGSAARIPRRIPRRITESSTQVSRTVTGQQGASGATASRTAAALRGSPSQGPFELPTQSW